MARSLTTLSVIRTEHLGPHMVRVYAGGPGLAGFTPNEFTDAYVKLLFLRPDYDYSDPLDPESLPPEAQPIMRTYTVRRIDTAKQELAIDFVVHGDEGVAGPWALAARPGDPMYLRGPGGAYAPKAGADWHLLAGDETAIPAIGAALEALPAGAVAKVFIEVGGPEDEIAIDTDIPITWLHRGAPAGAVGPELVDDNAPVVRAVRETEWLPGRPQVFIHGEAQSVMHNLRGYIRKERGVPAEWASISGYWRRGRTEEGFREWKSELRTSGV